MLVVDFFHLAEISPLHFPIRSYLVQNSPPYCLHCTVGDQNRLAHMNAVFRTIDLTCLTATPVLAGLLFTYINYGRSHQSSICGPGHQCFGSKYFGGQLCQCSLCPFLIHSSSPTWKSGAGQAKIKILKRISDADQRPCRSPGSATGVEKTILKGIVSRD